MKIKLLIEASFCFSLKNFLSLFLSIYLHCSFKTQFWNVEVKSQSIVNICTKQLDCINWFNYILVYIKSVWNIFFLLKIFASNLSGLTTTILLFLSQLTTEFDSSSKERKRLSYPSLVTLIVLPLAKLLTLDLINHKNKLLRNTMRRIIPNTDPCGKPEGRISNMLPAFLVWTIFFIFQVTSEESHRIKFNPVYLYFGYKEIVRDAVKRIGWIHQNGSSYQNLVWGFYSIFN